MNRIILQEREFGNIESSLQYFLKFSIQRDMRILDIGCSFGSLIYNLYVLGYRNVYGIDINQEMIKHGQNQYEEIACKIQTYDGGKLPFEDEFFDVILMFDVIEHIADIDRFIKEEVYRVLKKDGVFIFQTPNKLVNVLWEIIDKRSFTIWRKDNPALQTCQHLKKLLNTSGFKRVKIEKYNIYTEHNIAKVRRRLGVLGVFVLKSFSIVPLFLYPNFWGSGVKQ
jgi:2-polyprenyl-3-methyl-5-hydroxy-6-metoxy-1,4-benzoquinol methylase